MYEIGLALSSINMLGKANPKLSRLLYLNFKFLNPPQRLGCGLGGDGGQQHSTGQMMMINGADDSLMYADWVQPAEDRDGVIHAEAGMGMPLHNGIGMSTGGAMAGAMMAVEEG